MADFIQFANDEAVTVTDPMFLKKAVEQYVETKPSYKKGDTSAFAIGNEENPDVCIYCDEKLEGCNSFMEKTLKERMKFLAKQELAMDA